MATVDDIADTPFRAGPLPAPSLVAAGTLLAANAGMLYLYFALDLTLFQVVIVYWWEAFWIGLFSGLKLLTASLVGDPYDNGWIEVSPGGGVFLSLFAIVKTGGTFMGILAFTGIALVAAEETLTGVPGNAILSSEGMLLLKCSLLFAAGHGLSFVVNFLALGEFRRARFLPLIWLPFKRALALFVTIGVSVTALARWPDVLDATSFPALLIAVKLLWDFYLHRRERVAFAAEQAAARTG